MVDPSLVVHAYGYDERGLLLTDQLGDDPAQTLSSAPVATATTRGQDYVRTSPAGHATSLHLESTLDGTSTQRLTQPDGTSRSSTRDSAWQVT